MKILRLFLILGVLLVIWLAWANLPGLRSRVENTVDEYGGWTEEARRSDPVGFLDHAEEKLRQDIETFRESRQTLLETRDTARAELARNDALQAAANDLAMRFRSSYRAAEGAPDGWPAELQGARYSRPELVAQVESIRTEEAAFGRAVEIYGEVIETAELQRAELRTRIQTTEATLVQIRAQRELVRVQKLTDEADELLAQVDALLDKNQKKIGDMDEPVRSVEDLLAAKRGEHETESDGARTLEFLEQD